MLPFYGVARLKDGVSLSAAAENLTDISRELAQEYPKSNRDRTSTVLPLTEAILGNIRPTLITLLSGAALLCLIGFVNVSSLLLVKTESRRREIAVREALGASRLRLTRQFMIEGFLLAGCGLALGLALTFLSLNVLKHQIPAPALAAMPLPRSDAVERTHPFVRVCDCDRRRSVVPPQRRWFTLCV